jgi:hypothetical protein
MLPETPLARDEEGRVHRILQIIGYVVIALMAAGIIYGNITGIRYWSGIGV